MRGNGLLVSVLMVALFQTGVEADDVKEPAKQATREFLKAFAAADTAAMGKRHADEVIVMKGSTLLDKKYGGLGKDGARDKNVKVKKAALLKAYEKAIAALGGKQDWVRPSKSIEKNVEFSTVGAFLAKHKEATEDFKEIQAKPDDVLVIVNPKADPMVFFLRAERPPKEEEGKAKEKGKKKDSAEKWVVFAERWD